MLSKRHTENAIFKAVYDHFTAENISSANCVGICTDEAAALTEHKKDLQAEVQQTGLHMNFVHFIIHRGA
jgi:hypothetical protein